MRHIGLVVAVGVLVALPALGDDQGKAEKQLNRMTAMASDPTGRRVVGITMSDLLNVKRSELVQQRREMNLNYGYVFLARKIMAGGMTLQELAGEIKSGKSMLEIANARHGDWKEILAEAKKLNAKIDRHLYEHFVDARDDRQRDKDDGYNLLQDVAKADDNVGRDDMDSAADAYTRAHDLAMQRAGIHPDQSLDATDSLQFRRDHARDSAPKPSDVGVSTTSSHIMK
jgi:ribosome-binding protein aMBF1 (putative translation factor)